MKILLVCSAGMSTSLLVEGMKEEARKRQLPVEIEAIAMADFEKHVGEASAVLLGPQVRYKFKSCKAIADARGIPLAVIDTVAYGRVDGSKVLDQALALIQR